MATIYRYIRISMEKYFIYNYLFKHIQNHINLNVIDFN